MMSKKLLFILIIIVVSCDQGLSPDLADPKVGFGGTITFSGEWNSKIKQTLIVLFKDPLNSEADFNVFNLKYVSESIPFGSQTYKYSTNDISLISNVEPGVYSYLAVAQSEKDTISLSRKDWTVVGIYYTDNDSTQPGQILIPESKYVDSLDIHCDFNNLPPQPPGGILNLSKIKNIIEPN